MILPMLGLRWVDSWREALREARDTVLGYPLRSALGALAIAVAVGTAVLVDAAVGGLAEFARLSTARAFGAETFVLAQVASPGQVSRRELARMLERNRPLRRPDLKALAELADGSPGAPELGSRTGLEGTGDRVIYAATAQAAADVSAFGRKLENAAIAGTGAALPEIRELDVHAGRFFLPEEERRGAFVAVIGFDVAAALFPDRDPLGATLRLAGRAFTVVGVQDRQGTASGVSLDRYVWIPLPAFERVLGAPRTLQVSGRPARGRSFDGAVDHARVSLRARRALRPGEADDFEILTPTSARSFVTSLASRVSGAALPLTGMALLAAIVVVTNTTLVSVTQRIREIGVRRAIGASREQVRREVLAESTLVSLLGGLGGLAAAAALLWLVPASADFPLHVRPSGVAHGLVASALAGALSGLYPALRASRVDVATALRLE